MEAFHREGKAGRKFGDDDHQGLQREADGIERDLGSSTMKPENERFHDHRLRSRCSSAPSNRFRRVIELYLPSKADRHSHHRVQIVVVDISRPHRTIPFPRIRGWPCGHNILDISISADLTTMSSIGSSHNLLDTIEEAL